MTGYDPASTVLGRSAPLAGRESAHHSHTFPDMSSAPLQDAPDTFEPTGDVPLHPLVVQGEQAHGIPSLSSSSNTAVSFAQLGSGVSPQGYFRCTGPVAAYSHSASDGSLPPSHAHTAPAWALPGTVPPRPAELPDPPVLLQCYHMGFEVGRYISLERACPEVSRDMVRRVLRDLKAAEQVECLGRGPGARWRKKG